MILVILFLIISSLVGCEFFAYNIRYKDTILMKEVSYRYNFDTFSNGLITVFIVLTGDNWNNIMIDYGRFYNGALSYAYFLTILLLGNYILMKLFVAIVINNF